MFAFRERCIEIFNRTYPAAVEDEDAVVIQETLEKAENSSQSEFYITTEIFDENQTDTQAYAIEEVEEELKKEDDKSSEVILTEEPNDYEEIYLEFNDELPADETFEDTKKFKKSANKSMNRKSYTVEEKLQIIAFAEENRNRLAARQYGINESTVRCFRKQKEALLKMHPDKKTNRRGTPHWPKIEAELKQHVIEMNKASGQKIKMREIRTKAIELADKHGVGNFSASNSFVFKFMQRHKFPIASPRPRKKVV